MISSMRFFSYIGCFSSLCFSPSVSGLALQPEERSLESRQASFQTRIVDSGSTFGQESNGVWQLIE